MIVLRGKLMEGCMFKFVWFVEKYILDITISYLYRNYLKFKVSCHLFKICYTNK